MSNAGNPYYKLPQPLQRLPQSHLQEDTGEILDETVLER